MNYRAYIDKPYHISAGCVVIKDQKVLLLKRKQEPGGAKGGYHLPKGTLEVGETLEECALRETQEESGVLAILQEYIGATINRFKYPSSGMQIEKTTHYYLARYESDCAEHDVEHDEVLWLPFDKAIELLGMMPKSEDEIVRRAFATVKNNAE